MTAPVCCAQSSDMDSAPDIEWITRELASSLAEMRVNEGGAAGVQAMVDTWNAKTSLLPARLHPIYAAVLADALMRVGIADKVAAA